MFADELIAAFAKKLMPEKIDGRLSPHLAVGADLRGLQQTVLSDPAANRFQVPQGSFYLELDAGKHVLAYSDYDFANTMSREIFLMFHQFPQEIYMKIGRINLPYGLRIEDATSPIRTAFNMAFNAQDIGAEVGGAFGNLESAIAVTNGVPAGISDENLAKAVTVSNKWVGERWQIGSSFQYNKRTANRLLQAGLHGGVSVGKLTALSEFDIQQIQSRTGGGNTWVAAGYTELNWLIAQGLYAELIYDGFDPDYAVADNLSHRIGLGFDLYPLPYSEISLMYRLNIGTGALGDDEILARVHFFF
jgi:hypothetical protein